jgi:uncharacterized protein YraI
MMNFKLSAVAAALAVALSMTTGGAATAADTARASANLPIYSGPGLGYSVIGTLRKNARVELERCTFNSRWCLFNDGNGYAVGWVRGSYLIGIGAITRVSPFRFLVTPDFLDRNARN